MVCGHSFPLAHGAPGLGGLDEIGAHTVGREVVGGRVGGLEDSVALRGFGNDELLLGRSYPDDAEPCAGRLQGGWPGVVPDLERWVERVCETGLDGADRARHV